MTEIRIIRYSNDNGSREGVYFTEDLKLESDNVIPYNCALCTDTVIQVNSWDFAFPMDYNLERNY